MSSCTALMSTVFVILPDWAAWCNVTRGLVLDSAGPQENILFSVSLKMDSKVKKMPVVVVHSWSGATSGRMRKSKLMLMKHRFDQNDGKQIFMVPRHWLSLSRPQQIDVWFWAKRLKNNWVQTSMTPISSGDTMSQTIGSLLNLCQCLGSWPKIWIKQCI